eukprot:TRINITY_DN9046_c0_g1_i1.p1 TRINITY_DN9046_c0_g1~~TRINITY_DN9046_c0_g1_i1.p1  ORF type:complete len:164 (+),score=46.40 TRINITY_DN9046_c0_g1_i1:59-493(+)
MLKALLMMVCVVGVASLEKKGSSQHMWRDTELTTSLWRMCSSGNVDELKALIEDQPDVVHARSGDGRGPLWWAIENQQTAVFNLLISHGANRAETDIDGRTAEQMASGNPELTDYVKAELENKKKEMDDMDGPSDEDEEDDYNY